MEYHKNVMPELCQLAKVVLALPAARACAERTFSGLRFIIFVADIQCGRGYIRCYFISLKQSALTKTVSKLCLFDNRKKYLENFCC